MQSQTKQEILNVLEKYHQILSKENMKAVSGIAHSVEWLIWI